MPAALHIAATPEAIIVVADMVSSPFSPMQLHRHVPLG
jgi:hypothetical protein